MHTKKFSEWIELKERLHSKIHAAPYVSEGEIWWASIGKNVGSEINGKSQIFSRPVIIFKKLTHSFYFVIPLTTKHKTGSWYVNFKEKDLDVTACLHQVRTIDHRRLWSKIGELDSQDYKKIKDKFSKLYL